MLVSIYKVVTSDVRNIDIDELNGAFTYVHEYESRRYWPSLGCSIYSYFYLLEKLSRLGLADTRRNRNTIFSQIYISLRFYFYIVIMLLCF